MTTQQLLGLSLLSGLFAVPCYVVGLVNIGRRERLSCVLGWLALVLVVLPLFGWVLAFALALIFGAPVFTK